MVTLKKPFIITCIIVSFFFSKTYSQSEKSDNEKWFYLKESAHRIGFCIYHVKRKICNKHSEIKHELERINKSESEIYYFQIKYLWANNRLNDWAKTKKSNSGNYFILFDIDQKSFKKLYDSTKTSNSYMKFSVFDLSHKYLFKLRQKSDYGVTFYISSNTKESILTNTMWREFFSNRLGRLDTKIKISLNGSNALGDYHKFKEAFMSFTEK